jgi:hypothetical protein
MSVKNVDVDLMAKTLAACLCERGNERLLAVWDAGDYEASLWILRSDEGEVGYAVKVRHKGLFTLDGEPLCQEDFENIRTGLRWGLVALFEENKERVREKNAEREAMKRIC